MIEEDRLKKFIDQNRDEFDDQALPEGLWEGIESQLPKASHEKMVPLKTVLRIAASVLVLLTIALYSLLRDDAETPQVADAKESLPSQELIFTSYPDLAEAAFYYQSRIEDAQVELAAFKIDESDLESITILEEEMDALKAEMGEGVDNEQLIEAMMQIYQYKLDMLEDMLRQVKSIEKENDEESTLIPL